MNDAFKFFVPDIGDCIQLVEDWEFPLYLEGRNSSFVNVIKPGIKYGYRHSNNTILATLEAGTVLQVDRIYIRKGKSEWSSITFYIKYAPNDINREKRACIDKHWPSSTTVIEAEVAPEQKRKGCRFWAKLESVNELFVRRINNEDIPVDQKRPRTRKSTKPIEE